MQLRPIHYYDPNTEPPLARVVATKYSILTSDEIEKMSACELSNTTINKRGIVHRGGINDSRLGTTTRSMLCSTCANEMKYCPGHFGHIRLYQPVFNVEFVRIIYKILNCICVNCSGILCPSILDDISTLSGTMNRVNVLYRASLKCKVCPHNITLGDGSTIACNANQPVFLKEDGTVVVQYDDTTKDLELQPLDVYMMLDNMRLDDVSALLLDAPPSCMMWYNFAIPPVSIRPSLSDNYRKRISGEDSLSIQLRNVVKFNKKLYDIASPESYITMESKLTNVPSKYHKINSTYRDLANYIRAYQHHKYEVTKYTCNGIYTRKADSIRQRIAGRSSKKSRLRGTVLGKRMNYSARTVITPESNMSPDEIAVPIRMCKVLSFPEVVQQYNIRKLTRMVRNGPDMYPGANSILRSNGHEVVITPDNQMSLKLSVGDTVRRHIVRGDWAIVNRQPTLHKFSMMAHRILPRHGNTMGLHISCTAPYNADFDGDEMNLLVMQSDMSSAEASEILSVQQNMCSNSRMMIAFHQHAVLSAYRVTTPGITVPLHVACSIWNILSDVIEPSSLFLKYRDTYDIPGSIVFGHCLPDGLYIRHENITLCDGVRVCHNITKHILNQVILYSIMRQYGAEYTNKYLHAMQIALEYVGSIIGTTIMISDCIAHVSTHVTKDVTKCIDHATTLDRQLHASGYNEAIETDIVKICDAVRDTINDGMRLSRYNNLEYMIESGAKGNPTNIAQICGIIGQQYEYSGSRLREHTSHIAHSIDPLRAHGFIRSSFTSGMGSHEFFNHMISSRVGVVDTSVKTGQTGYCQRKLCTVMGDVVSLTGGIVCLTACHQIIQFQYGFDNFDPYHVVQNQIQFIRMNECDIIKKYRTGVTTEHVSRMSAEVRIQWDTDMDRYNTDHRLECILHNRSIVTKGINEGFMDEYYISPIDFGTLEAILASNRSMKFDCTPYDILRYGDTIISRILGIVHVVSTPALRCTLAYYLCPYRLLDQYVSKRGYYSYMERIYAGFLSNVVPTNVSVGIIAAQGCSHPLTQMTLNRFHSSASGSNLVSGIERILGLINVTSNTKNQSIQIMGYSNIRKASEDGELIKQVLFSDIYTYLSICSIDTARCEVLMAVDPYWETRDFTKFNVCSFYVDRSKCIHHALTLPQISYAIFELLHSIDDSIVLSRVFYSSHRDLEWYIIIVLSDMDSIWKRYHVAMLDDSTARYLTFDSIFNSVMSNCILKGCRSIIDYEIAVHHATKVEGGDVCNVKQYKLYTIGTNMADVMHILPDMANNIMSHDIMDVYNTLGIDAAYNAIVQQLRDIMQQTNAPTMTRHYTLISCMMCHTGSLVAMNSKGISQIGTSVVSMAAFEKTMDVFVSSAIRGAYDKHTTVADSIVWNSKSSLGTDALACIPINTSPERQLPNYITTCPPLIYCPQYRNGYTIPIPCKRDHTNRRQVTSRKRRKLTRSTRLKPVKKVRHTTLIQKPEERHDVMFIHSEKKMFVPYHVVRVDPVFYFHSDGGKFQPTHIIHFPV